MTAKITKSGKIESCKNFVRLVRKNIYPHIDFSLAKNNHYAEKDYLDSLTHIAMTHDFTTNGANTFQLINEKSPSANNVLYHMRMLETPDILEMFDNVFTDILEIAKSKNVFGRRIDMAIDVTPWRFYGDHEHTDMVVGCKPERGTSWAYKFASITIVVGGVRFAPLTIPVSQFMSNTNILQTLISFVRSMGLNIGILYLDAGFYSVHCIQRLEALRVKYIIHAGGARISRVCSENPANTVMNYTMRTDKLRRDTWCDRAATFKLCVVQSDRNPNKNVAFATNLVYVNEKNVEAVCNRYAKRWGIETGFRVQDNFIAKTTSKDYSVRLFYFLFSVCLYNLWILASILIGLVFGVISKKPIITAKMFATLLYTATLRPNG